MRVKLNLKDYGVGKLTPGKYYFVAYAGTSHAEVFQYTKKNRFKMLDVVDNHIVSSRWSSRSEMKRMAKLGAFWYIDELDVSGFPYRKRN